MTLIAETLDNGSSEVMDRPTMKIAKDQDELTIHVGSSFTQKSPMSEKLKTEKREEAISLPELFTASLKEPGNYSLDNLNWMDDHEVEASGLSKLALHNFILKAEALGKTIKYTRKLTVEITD